MKDSTLLNQENQINDQDYQLSDVISNDIGKPEPELDYLGKKFVYDKYNQNPDLVKENKFGYKVFFTRNQDLLDYYYEIRMDAYKTRLGFEKFNKLETGFDKEGKILLATKDGKVVAGMRLMFSGECKYFSAEYPGTQFQYEKVVRRYHDDREVITGMEASGIAVVENDRNFTVLESMFEIAAKEVFSRSLSYVYGIAQLPACRLYRAVLKKLGLDLEIVMSYPWEKKEVFNFSQMFPICVKLN